MERLFLILPVTLFEKLPEEARGCKIVIVEHPVYFGDFGKQKFDFSKPKLAYTKATLWAHSAYLTSHKIAHTYVDLFEYKIWRKTLKTVQITFYDPIDNDCTTDLVTAAGSHQILQAPNFLMTQEDLHLYHSSKPMRRFFHKHFYEWQRKRSGVLMNNNKPVGGKFSYDVLNRKPLPRKLLAPLPPQTGKSDTQYWVVASRWVSENFPTAPGCLDDSTLRFPVTYKGSRVWLKNFIAERLKLFGTYEDAIARRQPLLYHSGCSPMLLVGLLSPAEIFREVVKNVSNNEAPIESIEGFYRQLIWREATRYTYQYYFNEMLNGNYLRANRRLTSAWYDGTTGIPPVDDAIRDAFSMGYLHHIRRLMIMSSFMTLLGIHPHELLKWFLEFAVDSSQQIMCLNCLAMGSFGAGPLMFTKPYVCSSNYILKMSDYRRGDWCEIWDALYYNFWMQHGERLRFVRQGQFALGNLKKKSPEQRKQIQMIANTFIKKATHPA